MNKLKYLLAATALIVISYFIISTVAIKHIENNYDVKVETLSINWLSITANNVTAKREFAEANINKVTAKLNGSIIINGGKVVIYADKLKLNSKANNTVDNTSGHGLLNSITVTNISALIYDNEIEAEFLGVSFSNKIISFKSCEAFYNNRVISLSSGEIDLFSKEKAKVKVKKITTLIKIPFKLPKIKSEYIAEANNVKITLQKGGSFFVFADVISLENLITINNASIRAFDYNKDIVLALDNDNSNIIINYPYLSKQPFVIKNILINKEAILFGDGGSIQLDISNKRIFGSADCNDWVNMLPSITAKYGGTFSFDLQVDPPKFKLNNKCSFKCSQPIVKELFSNTISYMAYVDGKGFKRTIEAGKNSWVTFDRIPLHVSQAFIAREDEFFFKHEGMLRSAIENSLKQNILMGKFFRGGSTITMQLAKNLWLSRDKTILRKVNEAFLTVPLEQCLVKEKILELYLNIIEFGRNIYGINAAAKHYFHVDISELTEEQAFYLAIILPNPTKARHPDYGGLIVAANALRSVRAFQNIQAAKDNLP